MHVTTILLDLYNFYLIMLVFIFCFFVLMCLPQLNRLLLGIFARKNGVFVLFFFLRPFFFFFLCYKYLLYFYTMFFFFFSFLLFIFFFFYLNLNKKLIFIRKFLFFLYFHTHNIYKKRKYSFYLSES